MKFSYILALIVLACTSCNKPINITVENPSTKHYVNEAIAIDAHDILVKMKGKSFVVNDAEHKAVPFQVTKDSMLIILANISPQSITQYAVMKGEPSQFDTRTTGNVYPKRKDDLAWENDVVAFRAYGPSLQATGERGYGYDIFTKRDTEAPILESFYALEEDKSWEKERKALLEAGEKDKADSLMLAHSYHVDHGNGMDCFAVGPTLGAGCTALVVNDTIRYPWCYDTCEIIENGPLRFNAILRFKPVEIDGQMVTEVRDITLDAGRYLNRTRINYEGLDKAELLAAGFPLRDDGDYAINENKMYFCYVNPTLNLFPDFVTDQGKIYQGIVLAEPADSIAKRTDNGITHLVAYTTYQPGSEYDYYWGYGWNQADITPRAWQAYLIAETDAIKNPLKITIE